MSSLSSMLSRDRACAALVLAAMAAPAPAAARPDAAGDLVRLDAAAGALEIATDLLRDSARRCLSHQGAMLASIAAIPHKPGDAPPEGKSSLREAMRDPVGLRQARLDLYLVGDPVAEAREMTAGSPARAERTRELQAHADLRMACIRWSDRSLTLLKAAMRGAPGADLEGRLGKARQMALRDADALKSLTADGAVPGEAAMAGMATNRPGP